ncbi:MAG TPA: TfoX/Sxy family protein [Gammaproteobacteria bacterium]|nr:TfoX/Sxy family protein [Gammaproteobacteria bacterium]
MADTPFLDFVVEQLADAGPLKVRPMFGGHGLYLGASFFGIVHKGSLYLRTDEASRPAYLAKGSRPFSPRGAKELHRYYEAPAEVLEDAETLAKWARRACQTHD